MLESKDGPILKKESKMSKYIDKYIAPVIIIIFGAFLTGFGIWSIDNASVLCAVFIGPGVYIFFAGLAFFSKYNTKYEFTKEGILVKYPLNELQKISWDEFQQICICYTEYTTRGTPQVARSVICFVKKGEEKNGWGHWKTENPFHHRSVITVDYTEELYKEIAEKCPHNIPDLRKTRLYRFMY